MHPLYSKVLDVFLQNEDKVIVKYRPDIQGEDHMDLTLHPSIPFYVLSVEPVVLLPNFPEWHISIYDSPSSSKGRYFTIYRGWHSILWGERTWDKFLSRMWDKAIAQDNLEFQNKLQKILNV